MLACSQEDDSVIENLAELWVLAHSSSLTQQVAALRLLLAFLNSVQFQYPLTDEEFMDTIIPWSIMWPLECSAKPPAGRQHDEAVLEGARALLEARQVYSVGEEVQHSDLLCI